MMYFLVVMVVVLGLALMLVVKSRPQERAKPAQLPRETPKQILQRRYAAGEINEDEYLRRMSGLSQDW